MNIHVYRSITLLYQSDVLLYLGPVSPNEPLFKQHCWKKPMFPPLIIIFRSDKLSAKLIQESTKHYMSNGSHIGGSDAQAGYHTAENIIWGYIQVPLYYVIGIVEYCNTYITYRRLDRVAFCACILAHPCCQHYSKFLSFIFTYQHALCRYYKIIIIHVETVLQDV